MNVESIPWSDLSVGIDITVRHNVGGRDCGQGGVVECFDHDSVTVVGPDGCRHSFDRRRVLNLTVEVPLPTEECLQFGEDCSGPVDFHSVDGNRAWPRCEYHFAERLKRYENSIERYANSDVEPEWFDPSFAGESW